MNPSNQHPSGGTLTRSNPTHPLTHTHSQQHQKSHPQISNQSIKSAAARKSTIPPPQKRRRKFTIGCTTEPEEPITSLILKKIRAVSKRKSKSKAKDPLRKSSQPNNSKGPQTVKSAPNLYTLDKNLSKGQISQKSVPGSLHTNTNSMGALAPTDLQPQLQTKAFKSNYIKTTRYNSFNFLPKTLLEQFTKPFVLYFLAISILELIPGVSPVSPFTSLTPLFLIIAISIVRLVFEDLQRYKIDLELNSGKCEVWRNGKWNVSDWCEVKVGEVVKVAEFVGEENRKTRDRWGNGSGFGVIPADLVCLGSSFADWVESDWTDTDYNGIPDDEEGLCYISTENLDGVIDLEVKTGFAETQELIGNGEVVRVVGDIELDAPSGDLRNVKGVLTLAGRAPIEITEKNFLPRGAILKNTEWVIGVCAYTGEDTKIMQNGIKQAPNKKSYVDQTTSLVIFIVIGMHVSFSILVGFLNGFWCQIWSNKYRDFIPYRYGPLVEGILAVGTTLVITHSFVPISLLISLEMAQLAQAFFINADLDMYNKFNQQFSRVLNSNLNEELGQIQHIICDKTGTLTRNQLDLRFCFIGDLLYGDKTGLPKIGLSFDHSSGVQALKIENGGPGAGRGFGQSSQPHKIYHRGHDGTLFFAEKNAFIEDFIPGINTDFEDYRLSDLESGLKEDRVIDLKLLDVRSGTVLRQIKFQHEIVFEFFLCLSLCHSCSAIKGSLGMRYQGISADEVCLVTAAHKMGFSFISPAHGCKKVEILGSKTYVEQLMYLEFSPERRRSSTIVRHNGMIKLFVKGADDYILDRLAVSKKYPQPYLDSTIEAVGAFAKTGLRILVVAMRIITEVEFQEIAERLAAARKSSFRAEAEDEIMRDVEQGLTIIGMTAVEDKIRDDVVETIEDLSKADIKVWMATGDKLETAVSVAHASNLIRNSFKKVYLLWAENLEKVYLEVSQAVKIYKSKRYKVALVIEGRVLTELMNMEKSTLRNHFIKEILEKCKTVVCFRATPEEKAQLVRIVKKEMKSITLAIGDGCNDTNMLQEANIGIAVHNKNSTRAVQAADYVLSEFKSIWKLLFVHGRLNYIRICNLTNYFFYKSMLLTFPQLIYCFFNAYSGQTIFDQWFFTFYDFFFTTIPIIVLAVFDRDIYYQFWWGPSGEMMSYLNLRPNLKANYPYLYYVGQKGHLFSLYSFFKEIIVAFVFAACVLLTTLFSSDNEAFSVAGYTSDIWTTSIIVYTTILLSVQLTLVSMTKRWTIFNIAAMLLTSVLLYPLFLYLSNSNVFFAYYKTVFDTFFSSFRIYVIAILFVGISVVLDYGILTMDNEIDTSLERLYLEILDKNRENEAGLFEAIVHDFKKRELLNVIMSKKRKKEGAPVNDFERERMYLENELGPEPMYNTTQGNTILG